MSSVSIFPRVIDCFPPLQVFPGCSVAPDDDSHHSFVTSEAVLFSPHVLTPGEIAIPSGMALTTSSEDLPSVPPPAEYWRLKRLDNSANVMDYWIKSSQEWDISGLESDAQLATAREATVRQ